MGTNATRLIKKYANRRLYDTEQSLYITLDDLKKHVLDKVSFKVLDAKTEEDVTRACLVQIILEMEADSLKPFFSQETLENILRFYDNPLHDLMKGFLEQYLNIIAGQQQQLNKTLSESENRLNWWDFWSKEVDKKFSKD